MMKKAREFDNILDNCLERVLKGETIEQCLAEYPEHAAELEPLLRTALSAKEAAAIKPRPEFRDRARYQFQTALREVKPERAPGFFSWQRRWVTVVVSVFALLVVSGTVAAASNSLPDEPLYKVKLATEAVRLALTPSALGKAELYAELADKRVEEIIKMADKGKVEQVEQATERLDSQLVAMASLVVPDEEESAERGIATFEAAPPAMIAEEAPQVPVEEATPAPIPAPAPVEKMPVEEAPTAQVGEVPLAAAEKAPVPAPRVSVSADNAVPVRVAEGDAEDTEADRQEKLRQFLLRRAVENPEALEEALERAPESVKDALRRAIEVADQGYEQALRSLD